MSRLRSTGGHLKIRPTELLGNLMNSVQICDCRTDLFEFGGILAGREDIFFKYMLYLLLCSLHDEKITL